MMLLMKVPTRTPPTMITPPASVSRTPVCVGASTDVDCCERIVFELSVGDGWLPSDPSPEEALNHVFSQGESNEQRVGRTTGRAGSGEAPGDASILETTGSEASPAEPPSDSPSEPPRR